MASNSRISHRLFYAAFTTIVDDVIWLILLAHVWRSAFAMYVGIHIWTAGLKF
jgi:hypothetical protein